MDFHRNRRKIDTNTHGIYNNCVLIIHWCTIAAESKWRNMTVSLTNIRSFRMLQLTTFSTETQHCITMLYYITQFTAWNFTTYLFTSAVFISMRSQPENISFSPIIELWTAIRIIRMNARYIGLGNYASASIINRQRSWLTMTHGAVDDCFRSLFSLDSANHACECSRVSTNWTSIESLTSPITLSDTFDFVLSFEFWRFN